MIYKPLQCLFRICGIAPQNNHYDKYFTAVSCIVQIFSFIHGITSLLQSESDLIELTAAVVCYITMFLAITGFNVQNSCYCRTFISITRDLEKVDHELQNIEVFSGPIIGLQRAISLLFVITSLLLVFTLRWIPTGELTIAMITFALINAPLIQQMVLVSLLNSRFVALNKKLMDSAINTELSSRSSLLDSVFKIHSRMQAIFVKIDLHFSLFNNINFCYRFSYCVFLMYEYLRSVTENMLVYEHPIIFAIQASLFFCQVFVCHACAREANRTVVISHRMLIPDSPQVLWEEVGVFSALATDNSISFTIGGIFTLDRAIITNSALTALTYLIIALQLKGLNLVGDVTSDSYVSHVSSNGSYT